MPAYQSYSLLPQKGTDKESTGRRVEDARSSTCAKKVGLAHGYALEPVYHIPPEKLLAAGEGDKAARDDCEGILLEQVKHRNDEQRPSMARTS